MTQPEQLKGTKRTPREGAEPIWMGRYPNITRSQAVQLFCRECMGYSKHRGDSIVSETWQVAGKMAKECTDGDCPLNRFRPGAKSRKTSP